MIAESIHKKTSNTLESSEMNKNIIQKKENQNGKIQPLSDSVQVEIQQSLNIPINHQINNLQRSRSNYQSKSNLDAFIQSIEQFTKSGLTKLQEGNLDQALLLFEKQNRLIYNHRTDFQKYETKGDYEWYKLLMMCKINIGVALKMKCEVLQSLSVLLDMYNLIYNARIDNCTLEQYFLQDYKGSYDILLFQICEAYIFINDIESYEKYAIKCIQFLENTFSDYLIEINGYIIASLQMSTTLIDHQNSIKNKINQVELNNPLLQSKDKKQLLSSTLIEKKQKQDMDAAFNKKIIILQQCSEYLGNLYKKRLQLINAQKLYQQALSIAKHLKNQERINKYEEFLLDVETQLERKDQFNNQNNNNNNNNNNRVILQSIILPASLSQDESEKDINDNLNEISMPLENKQSQLNTSEIIRKGADDVNNELSKHILQIQRKSLDTNSMENIPLQNPTDQDYIEISTQKQMNIQSQLQSQLLISKQQQSQNMIEKQMNSLENNDQISGGMLDKVLRQSKQQISLTNLYNKNYVNQSQFSNNHFQDNINQMANNFMVDQSFARIQSISSFKNIPPVDSRSNINFQFSQKNSKTEINNDNQMNVNDMFLQESQNPLMIMQVERPQTSLTFDKIKQKQYSQSIGNNILQKKDSFQIQSQIHTNNDSNKNIIRPLSSLVTPNKLIENNNNSIQSTFNNKIVRQLSCQSKDENQKEISQKLKTVQNDSNNNVKFQNSNIIQQTPNLQNNIIEQQQQKSNNQYNSHERFENRSSPNFFQQQNHRINSISTQISPKQNFKNNPFNQIDNISSNQIFKRKIQSGVKKSNKSIPIISTFQVLGAREIISEQKYKKIPTSQPKKLNSQAFTQMLDTANIFNNYDNINHNNNKISRFYTNSDVQSNKVHSEDQSPFLSDINDNYFQQFYSNSSDQDKFQLNNNNINLQTNINSQEPTKLNQPQTNYNKILGKKQSDSQLHILKNQINLNQPTDNTSHKNNNITNNKIKHQRHKTEIGSNEQSPHGYSLKSQREQRFSLSQLNPNQNQQNKKESSLTRGSTKIDRVKSPLQTSLLRKQSYNSVLTTTATQAQLSKRKMFDNLLNTSNTQYETRIKSVSGTPLSTYSSQNQQYPQLFSSMNSSQCRNYLTDNCLLDSVLGDDSDIKNDIHCSGMNNPSKHYQKNLSSKVQSLLEESTLDSQIRTQIIKNRELRNIDKIEHSSKQKQPTLQEVATGLKQLMNLIPNSSKNQDKEEKQFNQNNIEHMILNRPQKKHIEHEDDNSAQRNLEKSTEKRRSNQSQEQNKNKLSLKSNNNNNNNHIENIQINQQSKESSLKKMSLEKSQNLEVDDNKINRLQRSQTAYKKSILVTSNELTKIQQIQKLQFSNDEPHRHQIRKVSLSPSLKKTTRQSIESIHLKRISQEQRSSSFSDKEKSQQQIKSQKSLHTQKTIDSSRNHNTSSKMKVTKEAINQINKKIDQQQQFYYQNQKTYSPKNTPKQYQLTNKINKSQSKHQVQHQITITLPSQKLIIERNQSFDSEKSEVSQMNNLRLNTNQSNHSASSYRQMKNSCNNDISQQSKNPSKKSFLIAQHFVQKVSGNVEINNTLHLNKLQKEKSLSPRNNYQKIAKTSSIRSSISSQYTGNKRCDTNEESKNSIPSVLNIQNRSSRTVAIQNKKPLFDEINRLLMYDKAARTIQSFMKQKYFQTKKGIKSHQLERQSTKFNNSSIKGDKKQGSKVINSIEASTSKGLKEETCFKRCQTDQSFSSEVQIDQKQEQLKNLGEKYLNSLFMNSSQKQVNMYAYSTNNISVDTIINIINKLPFIPFSMFKSLKNYKLTKWDINDLRVSFRNSKQEYKGNFDVNFCLRIKDSRGTQNFINFSLKEVNIKKTNLENITTLNQWFYSMLNKFIELENPSFYRNLKKMEAQENEENENQTNSIQLLFDKEYNYFNKINDSVHDKHSQLQKFISSTHKLMQVLLKMIIPKIKIVGESITITTDELSISRYDLQKENMKILRNYKNAVYSQRRQIGSSLIYPSQRKVEVEIQKMDENVMNYLAAKISMVKQPYERKQSLFFYQDLEQREDIFKTYAEIQQSEQSPTNNLLQSQHSKQSISFHAVSKQEMKNINIESQLLKRRNKQYDSFKISNSSQDKSSSHQLDLGLDKSPEYSQNSQDSNVVPSNKHLAPATIKFMSKFSINNNSPSQLIKQQLVQNLQIENQQRQQSQLKPRLSGQYDLVSPLNLNSAFQVGGFNERVAKTNNDLGIQKFTESENKLKSEDGKQVNSDNHSIVSILDYEGHIQQKLNQNVSQPQLQSENPRKTRLVLNDQINFNSEKGTKEELQEQQKSIFTLKDIRSPTNVNYQEEQSFSSHYQSKQTLNHILQQEIGDQNQFHKELNELKISDKNLQSNNFKSEVVFQEQLKTNISSKNDFVSQESKKFQQSENSLTSSKQSFGTGTSCNTTKLTLMFKRRNRKQDNTDYFLDYIQPSQKNIKYYKIQSTANPFSNNEVLYKGLLKYKRNYLFCSVVFNFDEDVMDKYFQKIVVKNNSRFILKFHSVSPKNENNWESQYQLSFKKFVRWFISQDSQEFSYQKFRDNMGFSKIQLESIRKSFNRLIYFDQSEAKVLLFQQNVYEKTLQIKKQKYIVNRNQSYVSQQNLIYAACFDNSLQELMEIIKIENPIEDIRINLSIMKSSMFMSDKRAMRLYKRIQKMKQNSNIDYIAKLTSDKQKIQKSNIERKIRIVSDEIDVRENIPRYLEHQFESDISNNKLFQILRGYNTIYTNLDEQICLEIDDTVFKIRIQAKVISDRLEVIQEEKLFIFVSSKTPFKQTKRTYFELTNPYIIDKVKNSFLFKSELNQAQQKFMNNFLMKKLIKKQYSINGLKERIISFYKQQVVQDGQFSTFINFFNKKTFSLLLQFSYNNRFNIDFNDTEQQDTLRELTNHLNLTFITDHLNDLTKILINKYFECLTTQFFSKISNQKYMVQSTAYRTKIQLNLMPLCYIILSIHPLAKQKTVSHKFILNLSDLDSIFKSKLNHDTIFNPKSLIQISQYAIKKIEKVNFDHYSRFIIPLRSFYPFNRNLKKLVLVNSFSGEKNYQIDNKFYLSPLSSMKLEMNYMKIIYKGVNKVQGQYCILTIKQYQYLDYYQISIYFPISARKYSTFIYEQNIRQFTDKFMHNILQYPTTILSSKYQTYIDFAQALQNEQIHLSLQESDLIEPKEFCSLINPNVQQDSLLLFFIWNRIAQEIKVRKNEHNFQIFELNNYHSVLHEQIFNRVIRVHNNDSILFEVFLENLNKTQNHKISNPFQNIDYINTSQYMLFIKINFFNRINQYNEKINLQNILYTFYTENIEILLEDLKLQRKKKKQNQNYGISNQLQFENDSKNSSTLKTDEEDIILERENDKFYFRFLGNQLSTKDRYSLDEILNSFEVTQSKIYDSIFYISKKIQSNYQVLFMQEHSQIPVRRSLTPMFQSLFSKTLTMLSLSRISPSNGIMTMAKQLKHKNSQIQESVTLINDNSINLNNTLAPSSNNPSQQQIMLQQNQLQMMNAYKEAQQNFLRSNKINLKTFIIPKENVVHQEEENEKQNEQPLQNLDQILYQHQVSIPLVYTLQSGDNKDLNKQSSILNINFASQTPTATINNSQNSQRLSIEDSNPAIQSQKTNFMLRNFQPKKSLALTLQEYQQSANQKSLNQTKQQQSNSQKHGTNQLQINNQHDGDSQIFSNNLKVIETNMIKKDKRFKANLKTNTNLNMGVVENSLAKNYIILYRKLLTFKPLIFLSIIYSERSKKIIFCAQNLKNSQQLNKKYTLNQIEYIIPYASQMIENSLFQDIGERLYLAYKNRIIVAVQQDQMQ